MPTLPQQLPLSGNGIQIHLRQREEMLGIDMTNSNPSSARPWSERLRLWVLSQ